MLRLTIELVPEFWDEGKEQFIAPETVTLSLEHSLISVSKWESKWCKSFLHPKELTDEELAAKAEDERASVLATLSPEQWRAIRRRGQEAHLLTVAESAPSLLAAVIDAACQPTRRRSERLARTTTPEGAGDPPIHRMVNLPRSACHFPSP